MITKDNGYNVVVPISRPTDNINPTSTPALILFIYSSGFYWVWYSKLRTAFNVWDWKGISQFCCTILSTFHSTCLKFLREWKKL